MGASVLHPSVTALGRVQQEIPAGMGIVLGQGKRWRLAVGPGQFVQRHSGSATAGAGQPAATAGPVPAAATARDGDQAAIGSGASSAQ